MITLTEEMVIARSRQSDLGSIKKLNCWGSDLSDVSIIRRMTGVELLALSVNNISTLAVFEECQNLKELYLRKNNIQDINEIAYLQGLPNLRKLWLEENPCCDNAGPTYRSMVLRALPNLQKLDNVDVTPEEVQDALRSSVQHDEEVYEDVTNQQHTQQHTQQQYQQQQQLRSQNPVKEQENQSYENIEEIISDPINQASMPSSPPLQHISSNQDFSPPEQIHPPSPNNNKDHRHSYHQYDRSPGSDQESLVCGCHKERGPISTSISTHSMKEYYQSDYQKPSNPVHYRHSQTDLPEWDEHANSQYNGGNHQSQRRSAGTKRKMMTNYRNGNCPCGKVEWDENERIKRDSRSDGRFNDTASAVSNAVLNHYACYHRRPMNRSSNLLSATLCLLKELDYSSLEVVEHTIRCRIDELAPE